MVRRSELLKQNIDKILLDYFFNSKSEDWNDSKYIIENIKFSLNYDKNNYNTIYIYIHSENIVPQNLNHNKRVYDTGFRVDQYALINFLKGGFKRLKLYRKVREIGEELEDIKNIKKYEDVMEKLPLDKVRKEKLEKLK